jgi:hypothetical protein
MSKCGVYQIKNKVNGKVYIGSTVQNFRDRLNIHLSVLRNNKHHSSHLQKSWNKYGEDNFEFSIVEFIEQGRVDFRKYTILREQYYMDLTKCYKREYGYNMNDKASGNSSKARFNFGKSREIPIIQYDLEYNFIKKWNSTIHASKELGLSPRLISRCINMKQRHSGGFIWRYHYYENHYCVEYQVWCKSCKQRVGLWAYGNWDL